VLNIQDNGQAPKVLIKPLGIPNMDILSCRSIQENQLVAHKRGKPGPKYCILSQQLSLFICSHFYLLYISSLKIFVISAIKKTLFKN
jgi:hypothetical protein